MRKRPFANGRGFVCVNDGHRSHRTPLGTCRVGNHFSANLTFARPRGADNIRSGTGGGAAPSVGYVHGLLAAAQVFCSPARAPGSVPCSPGCTRSAAVRPAQGRPRTPKVWKKTECYLLAGTVIVHDRYQNDDSVPFDRLTHQLCTPHLLRDLDGAAQVYPDTIWPTQTARALRELIHHANFARDHGATEISAQLRAPLVARFRHGVPAGLSDTPPPRLTNRETQGPTCCWRSCATGRTTCCASPPTWPCHPPPTRPNATYDRPNANERVRPTDQRRAHPGPLHHPRLPLDRRQTRPQRAPRSPTPSPATPGTPGTPDPVLCEPHDRPQPTGRRSTTSTEDHPA